MQLIITTAIALLVCATAFAGMPADNQRRIPNVHAWQPGRKPDSSSARFSPAMNCATSVNWSANVIWGTLHLAPQKDRDGWPHAARPSKLG